MEKELYNKILKYLDGENNLDIITKKLQNYSYFELKEIKNELQNIEKKEKTVLVNGKSINIPINPALDIIKIIDELKLKRLTKSCSSNPLSRETNKICKDANIITLRCFFEYTSTRIRSKTEEVFDWLGIEKLHIEDFNGKGYLLPYDKCLEFFNDCNDKNLKFEYLPVLETYAEFKSTQNFIENDVNNGMYWFFKKYVEELDIPTFTIKIGHDVEKLMWRTEDLKILGKYIEKRQEIENKYKTDLQNLKDECLESLKNIKE